MSVFRDVGKGQAMTNSRSEKSQPHADYRAAHPYPTIDRTDHAQD